MEGACGWSPGRARVPPSGLRCRSSSRGRSRPNTTRETNTPQNRPAEGLGPLPSPPLAWRVFLPLAPPLALGPSGEGVLPNRRLRDPLINAELTESGGVAALDGSLLFGRQIVS